MLPVVLIALLPMLNAPVKVAPLAFKLPVNVALDV
jgi:hypothetical protein